MNSTAVNSHGDTEVWSKELFNSTYNSSTFPRGRGSVGRAFDERRNVWLTRPSVVQSAGSKELSQFLSHARIETAMFIYWTDGILEIGTCERVHEDLGLMTSIQQFFSKTILPKLGQVSAHPAASQGPSSAPLSPHAASSAMLSTFPSLGPVTHQSHNPIQTFEPNSLNEQIIRRDMFLPQSEVDVEKQLVNELNTLTDSTRWRVPSTRPETDNILQTPLPAKNQALKYVKGSYKSHSGTTSSSVSSLEDHGSKPQVSVDSPAQNSLIFMDPASQRHRLGHRSDSHASASSRRGASSHSREVQLQDANTITAASQHELRVVDDDVINFNFEEEAQWQNLYHPPLDTTNLNQMSQLPSTSFEDVNMFNAPTVRNEPQLPRQSTTSSISAQSQGGQFKSWQHTRILAPMIQTDRTNQQLLRRCIDLMKTIPNLQQGAERERSPVMNNTDSQERRVTSSSSPEAGLPDISIAPDPFDQVAPSRGGHRPARGGSRIATMGPIHAGHDEAAMNHMMAERRRRVKQKENFSALRKLVPIISKADKASILGDAIVYLKDLQRQIEELKESTAETERRYEDLKISYQSLEQRNKELELLAGGANMRPARLHSMQSF